MRPAQSAALRLLYLAIAGTVVLPLVLFAYASWGDYLAAQKTADERIERSLEVVHEHASKVFEAVDLAFLHVAQLFRDVADERILADQAAYHLQLKAIDDTAPEIQSIVLFDRDGHPLVSSLLYPVPRELSAADRDYFRVQIEQAAGAYVGEVLISRDPRLATDQFFTVSRRRSTPEGAFAGVVRIGIRPAEFERFYAQIGRLPGSQFSMVREDGRFLARYPTPADRSLRLDESSAFRRTIAVSRLGGVFTSLSPIDGIERRIATRKLGDRPIYLSAGIETRIIRREWRSVMLGRLAFGLPATAIMVVSLALALARTRKLHEEAERREIAEAALRQGQRHGGDRAIDRRRGARFQQSAHDRLRRRPAPAAPQARRRRRALSRHDRERCEARREPDAPAPVVRAPAGACPASDRSVAADSAISGTCSIRRCAATSSSSSRCRARRVR